MSAPNIVFLILDDATFEQMQRMPQLMKLANTGVSFLNCYTSTAICQVARATFLTGQYAHNHGIVDNTTLATNLDYTTCLGARLQAAGYSTCHIGKYLNTWVLSDPVPAGWTEWHCIQPQQYFGYSINDNTVITAPPDYYTTTCTNRAVSYINSATQPFFMQVGYKAPHYDQPSPDSLNATPDVSYKAVVPTSKLSPRNPNFNVNMGTPPAYMAHTAMDQTKINAVDAFWRGSTEALFSVDQSIKSIVAALTAAGKTNTVIILTSDNGIFRGEGRDPAEKIAPYLNDLHIPLIISGPSNVITAQNKVSNQLTCHIDITATIYGLTGAVSTRTLDGISLVPVLTGQDTKPLRNYLLVEWRGFGTTGWGINVPKNRTVISNSYFYTLYDDTGEEELYDLRKDPFELINHAGELPYQAIQADLLNKLNAVKNCSGSSCTI